MHVLNFNIIRKENLLECWCRLDAGGGGRAAVGGGTCAKLTTKTNDETQLTENVPRPRHKPIINVYRSPINSPKQAIFIDIKLMINLPCIKTLSKVTLIVSRLLETATL